jgi:ABC-type transport system involved in multi-copper enzyme maturation permease subunit
MRLAYKAWRESQVRFFVSAAALVWFCSLFVAFRSGVRQALAEPFAEFVSDDIYGGGIRNLYVVFIVVLGLGGLLQERARGTAAFTLSLPVRRTRVVATRGVIGLLEVTGLAVLPTLVVCALAPLVHQSYPFTDALKWSARWTAGGAVLFAGSFFLSVLLGGPYSALATSMATLFGYSVLVNVPPINQFSSLNVFKIMENSHFEPLTLCAAILVAALIITVAACVTERQDF